MILICEIVQKAVKHRKVYSENKWCGNQRKEYVWVYVNFRKVPRKVEEFEIHLDQITNGGEGKQFIPSSQ